MFINRLSITNWRNFKSETAQFVGRTFVIGPNASGKSNFLDVYRFLSEIVAIKGGGFRQAVEKRGGVSRIRCLSARRVSDITLEFYFNTEVDGTGDEWYYKLAFSQNNNRNPVVRSESVVLNGKKLLERPDAGDKADPVRLTQTAIEQVNVNREFREVAQFFQSVSYRHLVPQLIRDPASFSPSVIVDDPFGRDFLQRVEGTRKATRDSRLRKICEALRPAVPQLKELEIHRDERGIPHLIGLFEHWRPGAGKQDESQFSDGTLRLFGLLWTLFEGEGLLLLEEPELSLHSEVVRFIPEMIERINKQRKLRRQVFISTHSLAMLQDKSIGPEQVLWLKPDVEGTKIMSPLDDRADLQLFKTGLSAADIVFPKTNPLGIEQLGLFE